MSRATKRKHVTREVEQDLTLPQQGQIIVKVSCAISVSSLTLGVTKARISDTFLP